MTSFFINAVFLLQISTFFAGLNGTQCFSVPLKSVIVGNAAKSSLFRPIIRHKHQGIKTIEFSSMETWLRMAEEKDDGSEVEASTQEGTSTSVDKKQKEPPKERGGFWTALILGPPLIAKFGIVILVKILTDLVVFPLLFLYRVIKNMKSKIVDLFGNEDAINGDKVNGAS